MARNTDADPTTVRLVRERDDWRCARCAGWGPLTTQHRVARGMGGTRWAGINAPANLVTLCGSGTTMCHGWVESHPSWAAAHGWSVRTADRDLVALTPVWTWRGWVRLRADGHLTRLPHHGGVPGCPCGCRPLPDTTDLWATPTY